MTDKKTSTNSVRIAQILLIITAILALLAGVGVLSDIGNVSKDALVVEMWRIVGLFTFAALFGVLAYKPTVNRPLWSIVIANKLVLTIVGIVLIGQANVPGAHDVAIFDGGITAVLLVASFLAGVWKK